MMQRVVRLLYSNCGLWPEPRNLRSIMPRLVQLARDTKTPDKVNRRDKSLFYNVASPIIIYRNDTRRSGGL